MKRIINPQIESNICVQVMFLLTIKRYIKHIFFNHIQIIQDVILR